METTEVYTKKEQYGKSYSLSTICVSVGLAVSFILIAYFLIIRTFALENIFYLRLVNILFLFAGIIVAERISSSRIAHKVDYLKGLRIGIQVTLVATIPYAIFMAVYLKTNHDFAAFIQNHTSFGKYLTPLPACVAGIVTIEGIVSGFILTYVIMPYFKRK